MVLRLVLAANWIRHSNKIVLYGSGEHVTHAARQLDSGRWTSKRGIFGDDIEHDSAEAIAGGEYYEILAYFSRPMSNVATGT